MGGWFGSVAKSLASGALHAGERVAADAAKREIARRLGEEDMGWFGSMASSLASGALHAGERMAADAAKREIARRLGEEDLSWWSTAMSLGKAAMKEAAPVVGAAVRDEISRDIGEE